MIVAVVGSRDFNDYRTFFAYMDAFRQNISIDLIVSGGAKGTDSTAYRYAVDKGITFVCHPPHPEDGYPTKFFRRNLRIANHAEVMIAFPKGKSSGTRHAISMAKKLGKKVYIIEI